MNHARHLHMPDWYQSDDSKLHFSLTLKEYPFKEWFEFEDRQEAVNFIAKDFGSQSFQEDIICHEGEIYGTDQFEEESLDAALTLDEYVLKKQAEVANLKAIFESFNPASNLELFQVLPDSHA